MNVNYGHEPISLRALNDGDAFEVYGTYWIKTDHRAVEKADDLVGIVELSSGYFWEWNANTKVQHMPDLTVCNGDPVAK